MELRHVGPGHFYAGIGSRETPVDKLVLMTKIAHDLSYHGWVLRSGGARGADTAFENGVRGNRKEIWLPWLGFNGNRSPWTPRPDAYGMAEFYHPNWAACTKAARDMHARNCHQVLGPDLRTKSAFVVCWTPDGLGSGGTGQAIRVARAHHIPVYDLAIPGTAKLLKARLS
jgi:hypothetical protein